jgi:hypothetical protein
LALVLKNSQLKKQLTAVAAARNVKSHNERSYRVLKCSQRWHEDCTGYK